MAKLLAKQQRERPKQQTWMADLVACLGPETGTPSIPPPTVSPSVPVPTAANIPVPNFTSFDTTSELWKDYCARLYFCQSSLYSKGQNVPNHTNTTYKLISTIANSGLLQRLSMN